MQLEKCNVENLKKKNTENSNTKKLQTTTLRKTCETLYKFGFPRGKKEVKIVLRSRQGSEWKMCRVVSTG